MISENGQTILVWRLSEIMKQLESGLVSKKLSKNESTLLTQIQNQLRIGEYTIRKFAFFIFSSIKLFAEKVAAYIVENNSKVTP